jgi:hypothetical protein
MDGWERSQPQRHCGARELYDFARVNACPIDRAPKEFHELDQPVSRIQ